MVNYRQIMIGCGLTTSVLLASLPTQGRKIAAWDGPVPVAGVFWPGPDIVGQPSTASIAQTQDGFTVAASGTTIEDTPAGEAIKLIQAEQWVKTIQTIESLDTAQEGLVLDARGVLRPLSRMKQALLLSMPEPGQRVFRQLNTPAANTRFDEAQQLSDIASRAQALQTIVNSYGLCDAAAQAAIQLGDIRLEQGRFHEAAETYHFAANHPAATTDDPGLMARRLTALARADRWDSFDELASYARFRHPGTTITLAGQSTALVDLIDDLKHTVSTAAAAAPPHHLNQQTLNLPQPDDHAYDRELIEEDTLRFLRLMASNHNLGGIFDETIAPIIATDDQRLFTLTLGRVARHTPETGTILWQTGEPDERWEAFAERMHNLHNGHHQALLVHQDTLIAAIPSPRNVSQSHLIALDADTGEERWALRTQLRRHSMGVVGQPLIHDGRLYVTTYKHSQELTLHVLNPDDGSTIHTLELGKASKHPHANVPAEFSPRLTMGQSHLLVQTNNGALIAVDPDTMTIAWAFSQKIRPSAKGPMHWHRVATPHTLTPHTGAVTAIDGTVIAKDTRTNQIVAFREHDAALLWTAPTDPGATIVHHDENRLYILGEELVALDRHTGQRLWWTPHPGDRAGQPVFTRDTCLIAGNHRLCRVDLTTGKLTHYSEDLAQSADLHLVGNQLLSITNHRLNGIRLPQ